MHNNDPYDTSSFHLDGCQGCFLTCSSSEERRSPNYHQPPVSRIRTGTGVFQGWWEAAHLVSGGPGANGSSVFWEMVKRPNSGCHVCRECHMQKHAAPRKATKRGYAEIQVALLLEFQKLLVIIFSFAKFSHNLLERGDFDGYKLVIVESLYQQFDFPLFQLPEVNDSLKIQNGKFQQLKISKILNSAPLWVAW